MESEGERTHPEADGEHRRDCRRKIDGQCPHGRVSSAQGKTQERASAPPARGGPMPR